MRHRVHQHSLFSDISSNPRSFVALILGGLSRSHSGQSHLCSPRPEAAQKGAIRAERIPILATRELALEHRTSSAEPQPLSYDVLKGLRAAANPTLRIQDSSDLAQTGSKLIALCNAS